MKKLVQSLFVLLLMASSVLAQDRRVTGKVTAAEDGLPLPGVSVKITGQKQGTQTDANGSFALNVPANAKSLEVSYIGFINQIISIGTKTNFNISLENDTKALSEVVVVGYGTAQKESFTGSASVVNSELIENRPISSFEKALQGAASGVIVTSVSGQPGAASQVRIRGIGSISANSSPLYVIDGVPITSGSFNNIFASDDDDVSETTSDVLSTINPNDIESVTVLKDASAGSIYGSRAANGVILITTKQGRNGATKFNATLNSGVSSIATEKPSSLSATQYFKQYFDYYYNTRITAGDAPAVAATKANASTIAILATNPFNTNTPYGAGGILNNGALLNYDTNWRDAVTNTGETNNFNLSAQGGNETTKFFLSGGIFDQKGTILASSFKRYSGKVNVSNQINNAIKTGVNTTLAYTDQNTPAGSTGSANPVRFGDVIANVYSLYARDASGAILLDPTGNPLYNYKNPVYPDFNPVGLAQKDEYITRTARAILNPYAEVRFLKDFTFKTTLGVDYINNRERLFYNPEHGNGAAPGGRAQRYTVENIRVTFTNTLNYEHSFGLHDISILAGQEAFRDKFDYISAGITGFPFDGVPELVAGSTPETPSSYITQKRLSSYFTRATYNYNRKYFLQGSFRRDGSSVFGVENRYGNFYSLGAAWRISEEAFLTDIKWMDELKLRASYGTSGNDNIGRYDALGQFGLGYNYEGQSGIIYTNLANPALRWEENKQLDIGLEFSVFENRLGGEISYYNRKSDGLLYNQPLSFTTGFETFITNLASMKNTGLDLLITANPVKTKDFNWDISYNITTSKNEIIKLAGNESISGSKRLKVGSDIYQFYIRDYAGVDPTNGQPLWYIDELDINGKPTGKRITTNNWSAATRYDSGSALPKLTGGLSNNFRYKQFDLNAFIFYSYGSKIYDDLLSTLSHAGRTNGTQLSTNVLRSWTPTNTVTDVPKFMPSNTALGNNQSTRFLFDGSYIRIKNVTLGYTLKNDWSRTVKLSNARIFISGENLFTFAKHKGMDPEVALTGLSDGDVPNVKTFSLGLSLGF